METGPVLGVLGRLSWRALPSAVWTAAAPSEGWFVQRVKVGALSWTDSEDTGVGGRAAGSRDRTDRWVLDPVSVRSYWAPGRAVGKAAGGLQSGAAARPQIKVWSHQCMDGWEAQGPAKTPRA